MDVSIDLGSTAAIDKLGTDTNQSNDDQTTSENISSSTIEEESPINQNALSKYFGKPEVDQKDDFFDSFPVQGPEDEHTHTRHRTISTSHEEKVCFEYEDRPASNPPLEVDQLKDFESFEGNEAESDPISENHLIQSHPLSESVSSHDTLPHIEDIKFDMGFNDGMYEAWIFNESTQKVLASIMADPNYVVNEQDLTKPCVLIEETITDPITDLMQKYNKTDRAPTLSLNDVQPDLAGLKKLLAGQAYRSAFNLTTHLLTAVGQGSDGWKSSETRHTPYTIQLWYTRIALLVKLRLYSLAETECHQFAFFEKPDLCYEFYCNDPDTNGRGSMVPFSMRILSAQLPQYLGKVDEGLERLSSILKVVRKISSNLLNGLAEDGSGLQLTEERRNASIQLWNRREVSVLHAMANALLSCKDYPAALSVYREILDLDRNNEDSIFSCMGRVYIMAGDIKRAEEYFKKSSVDTYINQGLLSIGKSDFNMASNWFSKAGRSEYVAANNLAVCQLYNGKLCSALELLQTLVDEDPIQCLHEGILFNLCTLYELESSLPWSKKSRLLSIVNEHKTDGFMTASLKLP
ncbi:DgyrCDS5813 [Dimorphilus gyrociliatus]|uniref:DgyrCDS5813 n=1 Tax=Dimorphilus gyrociliatus TaxID=2664684 RepID=A0A7I8VLU0_9ANNE|nr:DgyrCDS5813 [Dimorphilus gyrociliatus]